MLYSRERLARLRRPRQWRAGVSAFCSCRHPAAPMGAPAAAPRVPLGAPRPSPALVPMLLLQESAGVGAEASPALTVLSHPHGSVLGGLLGKV